MQFFLYPILFRPFYPEKKIIIFLYREYVSPLHMKLQVVRFQRCEFFCTFNHIMLVHVSGVLIVQINSITNSMQ